MENNKAAKIEADKLIHLTLTTEGQELSLASLRLPNLPEALQALIGQLKSLNLDSCSQLTDLSALQALTNLQSLDLGSCSQLTDLSALQALTNLQSLNLDSCSQLTDLSALQALTNLQSLDLGSCSQLTDLSALQALTNLQSLNLDSCSQLTDLSALQALTNLQSLNLSYCSQLTDLSALQALTNLQSLDLRYCSQLTDLSALQALTNLQSLNLNSCSQLTDLSALQALTNLQSLDLSYCSQLTDLSALQALTNLQSLNLESCSQLTDLSALQALTNLQSLNLSYCSQLTDLSALQALTNLQSLNLSYCRKLTDLSALQALTNLQSLNLDSCSQLTDLSALQALTNLQSLNLESCSQLTDLSALQALTNLQSLNLSYCSQLTDLSALQTLTNLQSLDLRFCRQLTDLSALQALTNLQSLNLSYCSQLTDLSALQALTNLQSLNLESCSQLTDLSALQALTNLQSLNLSYCSQLTDLSALQALTNLQSLNLSYCSQLTDLSALQALTNLQSLNLEPCSQLTDLSALQALTNLQSLNLSYCSQLTDLSALQTLTNLQSLDLRFCRQLTDLSALQALTNLQSLNLDYCRQLTDLSALWVMTRLRQLRASEIAFDALNADWLFAGLPRLQNFMANGFSTAPKELGSRGYVDSCLERLCQWRVDLATGKVEQTELKLFILGNGRVGKTQISRQLRGVTYDERESSTHGIKIDRFELPPAGDGRPAFHLNVWDFGGQDIYLSTHSLFLDERAIYLAVWAPSLEPEADEVELQSSNGDKPLTYWLDYIHSKAGRSAPVIVAQARCDRISDQRPAPRPPVHGFERIQETACSAKEGDLGRVREELKTAAAFLRERFSQVIMPASWVAIEEKLRKLRPQKLMSREAFDDLCVKECGSSSPQAVLHYLHQSGQVFWRENAFHGQVILDQAWALRGLYTLVNREDVLPLLRSLGGRFTRELLGALIWDGQGYTIVEQQMFLEMMSQCNACFRLNDGQYLALDCLPSYSAVHQQVSQLWRDLQPEATAVLRYDFLHRGVLHGMIAAVGQKAGFDAVYWSYGLCYFDQKANAVVRIKRVLLSEKERPGAGEIIIEASGALAHDIVTHLVESIKNIGMGREPKVEWREDRTKSAANPPAQGTEDRPFGKIEPGAFPDSAPVTTSAPVLGERPKKFLVLATEWFSHHGGLSTFNRQFCKALAGAGCEVVCVVCSSSEKEREHAQSAPSVTLVEAPQTPGSDPIANLTRRLPLQGFVPEVIVGHGRITGPAALSQQEDSFREARRIHFFHMAPEEIEWFKGKSNAAETAEDRSKSELELARGADLVAAVGPRLEREMDNLLQPISKRPRLLQFNPGISIPRDRTLPAVVHCLVLGRAEDSELKGLDIAAKAVAQAACMSSLKKLDLEPELVVRGAPPGTAESLRKELLGQCSGKDLSIRVREYDGNQETTRDDILRASLLLMPSRREGFGLVAVEALSLGTPLLVSKRSGVGELIKKHTSEWPNFVIDTPEDAEQAAKNWSEQIEFQLRDRTGSFVRAARLATSLAKELSWDSSAKLLLNALAVTEE